MWLRHLFVQLCRTSSTWSIQKHRNQNWFYWIQQLLQLEFPYIPYLFPLAQMEELKGLPPCMGGIYRPPDECRHDLRVVPSLVLTGECKNHGKKLDTSKVKDNLVRIDHQSQVHFVMCRHLNAPNKLFFTRPNSIVMLLCSCHSIAHGAWFV